MKRSQAEIVALAVGDDYESIRDSEYQPGCFSRRVFVSGGDYFCATKTKKPPRVTNRFGNDFDPEAWIEHRPIDPVVAIEGWRVWRSRSE